ncbi:MAG: pantetheine-phosphate adenylyltransferase [candidate division Zixibacteria bacterium]|nr:pantetheine-phosphate adenylyltransferase [candidate division Zixibacteria bacterium]
MTKKNKIIALYPGTFDPITNGHVSLVDRAAGLFDELVVAIARNSPKATLFTVEERFEMVSQVLAGRDNVRVVTFDDLLADYARKIGAAAIVRGLRAVSDFEYEFQMALMNRRLVHEIETVFLMPALSWVYLSSTIVKDVASNGGDITGLVPPVAAVMLERKFGR